MKKGNILLVILAITGILAASVGGYFWWTSQKPKTQLVAETKPADETANWKTFTDKVLGVSFGYPDQWHISAQAPGSDYYILLSNIKPTENKILGRGEVEFFVTEGLRKPQARWDKYTNIDTIDKLIRALTDDNANNVAEQTSGEINGNPFLTRSVTYPTNLDKPIEEIYILNRRGKVIIITHDGDISSFRKMFNQVLSTFRFIDQDSAEDTTSWKTYMSDQYGYSIKFPQKWSLEKEIISYTKVERITLKPSEYKLPYEYTYIEISAVDGPPGNCIENFRQINIAGVIACRSSLPSSQNPAQEVVIFGRGKVSYEIQMVYSDKKDIQIFDQILSTFKFL